MVIRLPEVESCDNLSDSFKQQSERTIPIEDIGVVLLDNKRITITSSALEALIENNSAVITCDSKNMPIGLLLHLCGNTTQNELPYAGRCIVTTKETVMATNNKTENK
ncbi:CRISPR associated protein Cas1-like protein [Prevotella sp. oral taxon 306 str. F0472]|nr:CRISPR associated protein Cas1-like protein [Prevotella sp. oral taxon 306 str. F0472]